MRVLFLDIDGCLHPGPYAPPHRLVQFVWLPQLVRLLASYPDVKIVVHSSWRHDYSVDELKDVLSALGDRVIDSTASNRSRYDSIETWLVENPEVRSWRILDDDETEFPDPPPAELIIAPTHLGVTDPATQERLSTWLQSLTHAR